VTTSRAPIIAFDLDGTLVDSVGDLASALNAALSEMPGTLGPLSVDVVRGFVGNGARVLVQRTLRAVGRGDVDGNVRDDDTDALLAKFRAHYDRGLVDQTRPFDGVPASLSALREMGARLAVATNKPGGPARAVVDALFAPGTFELVLGPDDVGSLKPDPAILARIALQMKGGVFAFVGDSGVDVETARNAGVRAVGVAWGLRPEEVATADDVVTTPSALVDVLAPLLLVR
jgi:phosphoglycolate phosphatase